MYSSFNARALGLKLSTDETLLLAHDHGFDGVDIMVRDAIEQGVDFDALKLKMDDLDLHAGAFPLPFDWRGDDASFAEGLQVLALCARAANCLGIQRTGTWVLPEVPERFASNDARSSYERTLDFHAERLSQIAGILDDLGIRLGLEVIGVASSRSGRFPAFIYRLDGLEPLIDRLNVHANIGAIVDAWHLYADDEPIANAFFHGVKKIVWAHVADLPFGAELSRAAMIDSVRGLPGEHGAIDAKSLLRVLYERGYGGPVTAEPLGNCRSLTGLSPTAVARKTAESLRSVWPEDLLGTV